MKIKNYTSGVAVSRTVARIEELVAKAGASGIQKEFEAGRLMALIFCIKLPSGHEVKVRLPSKESNVYASMLAKLSWRSQRHAGAKQRLQEQAARTAWKLMQDWVEVQLSLIALKQADFIEVFLPYVWDGKQTFYTSLKERNYAPLLLGSGSSDQGWRCQGCGRLVVASCKPMACPNCEVADYQLSR